MTTSGREAAESAITSMLRERGMDRIVRGLMGSTHAPQAMVEDALLHAVAATLNRAEEHDIANIPTYVFVSARNEVYRILKEEGLYSSLDEEVEDPSSSISDEEAKDLLRWIKALIKDWNENIRTATSLALDHAFLDEWRDLTMDDFATELEEILGIEVSVSTAAMWKHRGLKRLRNIMSGTDTEDKDENEWSTS